MAGLFEGLSGALRQGYALGEQSRAANEQYAAARRANQAYDAKMMLDRLEAYKGEDGRIDWIAAIKSDPILSADVANLSGITGERNKKITHLNVRQIGGDEENPVYGFVGVDRKGREVAVGDAENLFTLHAGVDNPNGPQPAKGRNVFFKDDIDGLFGASVRNLEAMAYTGARYTSNRLGESFSSIMEGGESDTDMKNAVSFIDKQSNAQTAATEVIRSKTYNALLDLVNKEPVDRDGDGQPDEVQDLTDADLKALIYNASDEDLRAIWKDVFKKKDEDFNALVSKYAKQFEKDKEAVEKVSAQKREETINAASGDELNPPNSTLWQWDTATTDRFQKLEKYLEGEAETGKGNYILLRDIKRATKKDGYKGHDISTPEGRKAVILDHLRERKEWEAAREAAVNEQYENEAERTGIAKPQGLVHEGYKRIEESRAETARIMEKYGISEDEIGPLSTDALSTARKEQEAKDPNKAARAEIEAALYDDAKAQALTDPQEKAEISQNLRRAGGDIRKLPSEQQLKAVFYAIQTLPEKDRDRAWASAMNIISTGDPTVSGANVLEYDARMSSIQQRHRQFLATLGVAEDEKAASSVEEMFPARAEFYKTFGAVLADDTTANAAAFTAAADTVITQAKTKILLPTSTPRTRALLYDDMASGLVAKMAIALKREGGTWWPASLFFSDDELNEQTSTQDLLSRIQVNWADTAKTKIKSVSLVTGTGGKAEQTLSAKDLRGTNYLGDDGLEAFTKAARAYEIQKNRKESQE